VPNEDEFACQLKAPASPSEGVLSQPGGTGYAGEWLAPDRWTERARPMATNLVNVAVGSEFPHGSFVMQNGKAPAPADPRPVRGLEYNGCSQFLLLGLEQVVEALDLTR
jgi:hypothetical protein